MILHPPEYASASGIVVDAEGKPVPGIPVHIGIAESPYPMILPAAVLTDSLGRFAMNHIPAGRHCHFYIPKDLARSGSFLSGKDPGPFRIELPLTDRWLEGTVRDESGKPVAGITVLAWDTRSVKSVTDTQGRFRLEGFVREQVEVSIRGIPGYFHFQNVLTNQSREFTIATGRHYLSGKVSDRGGKPLSKARIAIENPKEKNRPVVVETDPSGCFHLSGFRHAEAQITASCPGYREKKLTVKTDRDDVAIALEEIKKSEHD